MHERQPPGPGLQPCTCPVCEDEHLAPHEPEPVAVAALVRCQCPGCGWHHRAGCMGSRARGGVL